MTVNKMIPKLIRAAYLSDDKAIENVSILIGRSLRKEDPDVSEEIMHLVADHRTGAGVYRSIDLDPVPVDRDSRSNLLKIDENYNEFPPILSKEVESQLKDFIKERSMIDKFLNEDIVPGNSLLLYGKPGTGKTSTARWLAEQLNMPIVTVDLAATMSSYLGKSGQNIKSIFEYAKKENVVLFLDEFDAIAKKRDDTEDLGELKRLVNVLLKELEDCPVTCVVIGATNHPELLDKAVWRRFDRCIEVPMPLSEQRKQLIRRSLGKWFDLFKECSIHFLLDQTDGMSAADICRLCEHIKRQIIMNEKTDKNEIAITEVCREKNAGTKSEKIELCRKIKKFYPRISIRDLSRITSIPQASVARYSKGDV